MGLTFPSRYQQQQWQNHDTRQRLFAASVAMLITVLLSLQFRPRTESESEYAFLHQPFTVLSLQMVPAERAKVENQTPEKKSILNKPRLIPAAVTQAPRLSDSASVIDAEVTLEQTIERPVTLLPINSKSIAKAYNNSKSEIQKMAEASAKELNTPIKTKYDRFQIAAEQAAIPDCLAPQGPGGIGLFAIPVIAYETITGKCK